MDGFIDKFDPDISFGGEVFLDLILSFIVHIILDTKVEANFFVALIYIVRENLNRNAL